MEERVLGFLFDPTLFRVVLLRLHGSLDVSGLEGCVGKDGVVLHEMYCACHDRTGLKVPQWQKVGEGITARSKTHFFAAKLGPGQTTDLNGNGKDVVWWEYVCRIPDIPDGVAGLKWLVPMALSRLNTNFNVVVTTNGFT